MSEKNCSLLKVSAISLLAQLGLQRGFYFRPFRVDDAEIYGVADTAACGDHVIAKDALLAGADAQDGGTGAVVEGIGLQLHANAFERFEGVVQQQVFGCRVDRCALPLPCDPGPADFDAMMKAIDISVARAAHHAATGFFKEREG